MDRQNRTKVVIFIFTDGKKILVEKRFLETLGENHYLLPGGTIKEDEDLEGALQREMMEELGIKPLNFNPIPNDKQILGLHGQLLIPFLINKWAGQLPKKVLDKGTPLTWIEIEKLLNCPFEPTRKIVQAFKNHLSKIK